MSTGTTLSSAASALLVSLITLAYWAVRARAAQARTSALKDQVEANGRKLDTLASSPSSGSPEPPASSTGGEAS